MFCIALGDMVNGNTIEFESKYIIVYVFKYTALKLNVKSRQYTEIHNDNKEIVS